MKYAVLEIGGKQYKVSEGEEILVDKPSDLNGERVVWKNIFLVRKDDQILIGEPYIENCWVEGKILDNNVKGEKIEIRKFKAKVRYRRKLSFRPQQSRVLVEKIVLHLADTQSASREKSS